MRLHLLRHGAPEVMPGICYGSSDVTVPRHEHARIVVAAKARLPAGIPVFSSPLRRCRELALQLADALGSHPVFDARLAEMDFGAWELRHWDDIPRSEIDAWAADPVQYRPGGGESVLDMARRVQSFRDDLLQLGQADVLLVCHAGTIRLLLAAHSSPTAEQMAAKAASERHAIAYGGLLTLDC